MPSHHNYGELKQRHGSPPTPSGLLADSMGLGKTLSILSAVVSTLEEASRFEFVADQHTLGNEMHLPTRATLVVVPSARRWVNIHTITKTDHLRVN